MKLLSVILPLIILSSLCYSQQFIFKRSFGEFENASSFYINSAGIVYVTDNTTDEVYQVDTLGNELAFIGGYGWETYTFDDPVDVFADPLQVIVTDKNNHRIKRFDKNLNFIFEIYTRDNEIEEQRFGYPLSAVQSNLGDIFILDSENKRIIKFDPFGKFIQTIGGYDYGNFTLNNPRKLAISMQNNIYVIDETNIYIYDNYGTGLGSIEVEEEMTSIRIIFNWLTINSQDRIYLANLKSKDNKLNEAVLDGFDKKFEIVSSLIFNGKLYILTPKTILIYTPQ